MHEQPPTGRETFQALASVTTHDGAEAVGEEDMLGTTTRFSLE